MAPVAKLALEDGTVFTGRGFGGQGENIEQLDQVRPAVERAFAARAPYLLNVNIQGAPSSFTEWSLAAKKAPRS